jgi:hypothetical protein
VTIQNLSEHAELSQHAELIDAVARQEKALTTEEFHRKAREFDEAQSHDRAFDDLTQDALLRLLKSDPEFASGLDALTRQPNEPSEIAQIARHPAPQRNAERGQRAMSGAFHFGRRLDLLRPPYTHHSTQTTNVRAQAYADDNGTLDLSGSLDSAGGSFVASAEVGAPFMRMAEGFPPGQGPWGVAVVTPFVYANYQWIDIPRWGATTLAGSFEVSVRAYDMNGVFVYQPVPPFRVNAFNHQGIMFGESHNPDWPEETSLSPLGLNDVPPPFQIRTDMFYWVLVSCTVRGWVTNKVISSFVGNRLRAEVSAIGIHQD